MSIECDSYTYNKYWQLLNSGDELIFHRINKDYEYQNRYLFEGIYVYDILMRMRQYFHIDQKKAITNFLDRLSHRFNKVYFNDEMDVFYLE